MNAIIEFAEKTGEFVSENILGQNLELCYQADKGLQEERLSNNKFGGEPDYQTGIAPQWVPGPNNNFQGIRFEVAKGIFLSGMQSQLIHNYCGREKNGIIQTGRTILKGEELKVTLWARVQHQPVVIRVGIKGASGNIPEYDSQTIAVNTPYWKEYSVVLKSPQDDSNCTFFCWLQSIGLIWIDQIHMAPHKSFGFNQKTYDAFKSLSIPVLRFPGGCITTVYHWKLGIGEKHLRPVLPDPVFKGSISYEFGTDEYLQMCMEQNIKPHITINISTGTPEEAKEWGQYIAKWYSDRGISQPLIYWQIGNEHYGAWEIGNMNSKMYVSLLKEFVPAIKEVYQNSKIIALGAEIGEGLGSKDNLKWREVVLDEAKDLFDLISLQCYHSNIKFEDKTSKHFSIMNGVNEIKTAIQAAIDDILKRGLDKKVALTEWNLWQHATHHDGLGFFEPYTVQNGLFVASAFHMFIGLSPYLEEANFYNLLNPMGVFNNYGAGLTETVLADIFRLYRSALPAEKVNYEIIYNTEAIEEEKLDIACLNADSSCWLFLINKSISDSYKIQIKKFTKFSEGVLLRGNEIEGEFIKETLNISNENLEIPPLSIARLKFLNV